MRILPRFSCLFVAGSLLVATHACTGDGQRSGSNASSSAARTELFVYAAASTRDVMQKIESAYERTHNVDLILSFGSSGDLAKQIIASPNADVFLSADDTEMNRVDSAKLVLADSRRDVLSNQLAVVESWDSVSAFTLPFTPVQLGDSGVRHLSLGNVQSVPAGRYARTWLERIGVWSAVSSRVIAAVDVRAAVAAVEAGSAEAGIVYRTDVLRSTRLRTVYAVPIEEGPRISYPVAAIAGRPSEAAALEFIAYLSSPVARQIFEVMGFIVPATPPPAF